MQRLAVFGGTFDPPHQAHRALVEALLTSGRVDAVQVVPAACPPHKMEHWITPASYRLELVKAAFSGLDAVEVSDRELRRTTPSYTFETLEEIRCETRAVGQDWELYFVVGADSLLEFSTWREPERILHAAQLLVAQRPGAPMNRCQQVAEEWNQRMGRGCVQFFDAPVLDQSSSEIRTCLYQILDCGSTPPAGRTREGDPPGLERLPLAPGVREWILDHGLYSYPNWGQSCSLQIRSFCHQTELLLRRKLSPARLIHTLDVFALALAFAEDLGLHLEQVAQAALLHDCAKMLSAEEALARCPEAEVLCDGMPALYHGPVGAQLAQELYGVTDPAVLQAIRWHSTLLPDATDLDEWIFVADKLEPNRPFRKLTQLRRWIPGDLHRAAWETTCETQASLERRGLPQSSSSLAYRMWAERTRGYAILKTGGGLCNPKN